MDRYGDALTLGVEAMDHEHRRLAAMFERFSACIRDESLLDQAQRLVQQALDLANEHFEHEEALMVRYAYPAIEDEKRNHRNLRLRFTTLVSTTMAMPANDQMTLEYLADMERLLFEHITGPDRELATYLIARGVR
jgi:hemerythrin